MVVDDSIVRGRLRLSLTLGEEGGSSIQSS
jgi:hypothetical protein